MSVLTDKPPAGDDDDDLPLTERNDRDTLSKSFPPKRKPPEAPKLKLKKPRVEYEPTKLEDSPSEVLERFKLGCECQDDRCFRDLNPETVYKHRLNIAELTKAEHDMYLMGVTMACLTDPYQTARNTQRQRLRSQYVYQGRRVCLDAFLYLENCTRYQIKRIRKHLVTHGVTPRVHGNHGKVPHNTFSFDIYRIATDFLKNFVEEEQQRCAEQRHKFAEPKQQKTRIVRNAQLHLPSDISRKNVYDLYTDYCRRTDPNVRIMGYSTFRRFMKVQFPRVKFARTEFVVRGQSVHQRLQEVDVRPSNLRCSKTSQDSRNAKNSKTIDPQGHEGAQNERCFESECLAMRQLERQSLDVDDVQEFSLKDANTQESRDSEDLRGLENLEDINVGDVTVCSLQDHSRHNFEVLNHLPDDSRDFNVVISDGRNTQESNFTSKAVNVSLSNFAQRNLESAILSDSNSHAIRVQTKLPDLNLQRLNFPKLENSDLNLQQVKLRTLSLPNLKLGNLKLKILNLRDLRNLNLSSINLQKHNGLRKVRRVVNAAERSAVNKVPDNADIAYDEDDTTTTDKNSDTRISFVSGNGLDESICRTINRTDEVIVADNSQVAETTAATTTIKKSSDQSSTAAAGKPIDRTTGCKSVVNVSVNTTYETVDVAAGNTGYDQSVMTQTDRRVSTAIGKHEQAGIINGYVYRGNAVEGVVGTDATRFIVSNKASLVNQITDNVVEESERHTDAYRAVSNDTSNIITANISSAIRSNNSNTTSDSKISLLPVVIRTNSSSDTYRITPTQKITNICYRITTGGVMVDAPLKVKIKAV